MAVRTIRWRIVGAATAVVALVATGCSSSDEDARAGAPPSTVPPVPAAGADTSDDELVPGAQWERATPESMGMDGGVLDEVAAAAQAARSNCLVVTRKGRIVGDWYWNGTGATTTQEVFSATKSVASALVGIAQGDGSLDVDDPASRYIEEWAGGPSAAVTVRNLLSNDSGREWSLQIDYGQLLGAADKDAFAVGLGQDHEPGTVWAYNNAAIQTLDRVLRRATGEPTDRFAQDRLLGPIGMSHSRMTTDAAGNALVFMGLQSTCEDMARFGHLFLRGGNWGGEQIVPAEWVRESTRPSQELSSAYGFLWWLNRPGRLVDPMIATGGPAGAGRNETGQMVEGAPGSLYWARGFGGQIVAVDPATETVAVRLGPASSRDADQFSDEELARVVTEASSTRRPRPRPRHVGRVLRCAPSCWSPTGDRRS